MRNKSVYSEYDVTGRLQSVPVRVRTGARTKTKGVFFVISFALLIIYVLLLLIPLLWALMSSFKDIYEFDANVFGFPERIAWDNYVKAFNELYITIETVDGQRDVYLAELIYNSVIYSCFSTVIAVLSPCITAYAVAKYDFWLKKVLYGVVIVAMILPLVGSLPSQLQIMRALGFYDNLFGVVISKGSFLGMYFLIFYATFKSISWEYAEAARMDGASHFRIMTTVMFPLARTTIFAVMLLVFIDYWNEYNTQLIYLPSKPTLAYGLFQFQFSTTTVASQVTIQLAGCMLISLPLLILFMLFKNLLMGNLTVGGIKG